MREIGSLRLRSESLRRFLMVVAGLFFYSALTVVFYFALADGPAAPQLVAASETPKDLPARVVSIAGGRFLVDGKPFLIKAVGWDPVRPGELPWNRPHVEVELHADLERIKQAGFNTVRTWAPLDTRTLAIVREHGLYVLQGIWTLPDGPFDVPERRAEVLDMVTEVVKSSRWFPNVLGYLVLNEPRARAVAAAGLDQTVAFVSQVARRIHELDPGRPVGYASWPGMEGLDDVELDFVAFNLYPHRPRVVMDELGLADYLRLLRRTVARGRPLIVSEFGISVSRGGPGRGRGGATLTEQAEGLPALAWTFLESGVAGYAVFQWSDGWWKHDEAMDEDDELSHDPNDPEEWFGLVEFRDATDRRGVPRPALDAFAEFQRKIPTRHLPARALDAGAAEDDAIGVRLEPHRLATSPGRSFTLQVEATGDARAHVPIVVVTYTEDRYNEERVVVRTDAEGRAAVQLTAPDDETVMTVLAFEERAREGRPRATDRAIVEVRRGW